MSYTKWLPLLFIAISIPMALYLVPPNQFYGVRTAASLASKDVWYRANAASGWAGSIGGSAAIAINVYLSRTLHNHPRRLSRAYLVTLLAAAAIMVIAGVAAS